MKTPGKTTIHEKATIRDLRDGDVGKLLEMYRRFQPESYMLGVPPSIDPLCIRWINNLVKEQINVIALFNEKLVGHAAVIDVPGGDFCELILFVHQDFRGRGIGRKLLSEACRRALRLCKKKIWLLVDSNNTTAIKIYYATGFRVARMCGSAYEMEMDLSSPFDYLCH
jgi:GNAT superfamily N-acetyltransferase